jgi:hypothetical protein
VAMGVDENNLISGIHHAACVLKTVAGFKFREKGGWELRGAGWKRKDGAEGGSVRFSVKSVRGSRGS